MTGEADLIRKEDIRQDFGESKNFLMSGTIVHGEVTMIASIIGRDSLMGRISSLTCEQVQPMDEEITLLTLLMKVDLIIPIVSVLLFIYVMARFFVIYTIKGFNYSAEFYIRRVIELLILCLEIFPASYPVLLMGMVLLFQLRSQRQLEKKGVVIKAKAALEKLRYVTRMVLPIRPLLVEDQLKVYNIVNDSGEEVNLVSQSKIGKALMLTTKLEGGSLVEQAIKNKLREIDSHWRDVREEVRGNDSCELPFLGFTKRCSCVVSEGIKRIVFVKGAP